MKKLGIIALAALIACSFSVAAYAVDFTPSVERKDAPEIVEIEDSEGNKGEALIVDEEENEELLTSTTEVQIVLTPASEKDEAVVYEITEEIDGAIHEIEKAEDIGDLTPEMEKALEELKTGSTDPAIQELELEDFVICDLFDVSLVRDGQTLERLEDDETVTFRVQTNFTEDDVFFILQNYGDEWSVIKSYSLDENGVLTITLYRLGPLAFAVDNMIVTPIDPIGPPSPQTNDYSDELLILSATVFGLAAVFFTVRGAFGRSKQSEK